MTTCSVIDLGFKDLWTKGVLKNGTTKIEDLERFNNLNKLYSDTAREKFKVTNPGQFYTVDEKNISRTGPLNLSQYNREENYMTEFAVVNREFVDEFQEKFDQYNRSLNAPVIEIIEAAILTPQLQTLYDETKTLIEGATLSISDKEYLMNELNSSRTPEDFGDVLKKLC